MKGIRAKDGSIELVGPEVSQLAAMLALDSDDGDEDDFVSTDPCQGYFGLPCCFGCEFRKGCEARAL